MERSKKLVGRPISLLLPTNYLFSQLISARFVSPLDWPLKWGYHKLTNHADDRQKMAVVWYFEKVFGRCHRFVKVPGLMNNIVSLSIVLWSLKGQLKLTYLYGLND